METPDPTEPLDALPTGESTPGLWRLAGAATYAGMSPDAFAGACDRGDIEVQIVRIGPRALRYVRTQQFLDWLKGNPKK